MSNEKAMKRSRRVVLTTLTLAGVAAVGACSSAADWDEAPDGPAVNAFPYASVAECAASGEVPASECQAAYEEALASNDQTAPRFASQQLCEEQFGNGACQFRSDAGTSFWVPLMAGFVIAEALDEVGDAAKRRYRRAPLYRSRRDNNWYTGGAYSSPLSRSGSGYRVASSSVDRPVSSPRIRTSSAPVSRGGFGGRSRSSWGG